MNAGRRYVLVRWRDSIEERLRKAPTPMMAAQLREDLATFDRALSEPPLSARARWKRMRHELRLMRRLHRVRLTEGGANYRLRHWLGERVRADLFSLGVSGHRALF